MGRPHERPAALTTSYYLREIVHLADVFAQSRDRLEQLVQAEAPDENNQTELTAAVLVCLATSSNISKMLWPVAQGDKYAKSRGLHLREILGISSHQSLLKERHVRDAAEHYDERMDHVARGWQPFVLGHWTLVRGREKHTFDVARRQISADPLAITMPDRWGSPARVDLDELSTEIVSLRNSANELLS
ncbi:hypothetical protein PP484_gp73 [Gordonia phage Madeline]|uniref:Uncharacterized protein n=1 Tax=Gordonia phage Madeline TaxID=2591189 RepID=A0A514A2X7_9CAUD|nr:hypothetical protein PP484_gp73 [Gordonia phage Madeline]QDH47640.1 hypothetical protein SEA_MADELINE_37 [Gordonia phage Madeline]